MPAEWGAATLALPQQMQGAILVTVHPDHVARAALDTVAQVVVVGADPAATLRSFCEALDEDPPEVGPAQLDEGFGYLWDRTERRLRLVRIPGPSQVNRRHVRKYAEGELGADRSFYFRGPDNSLNLRAHNLHIFLQMADGVDDRT